jgi:hypothetical protein
MPSGSAWAVPLLFALVGAPALGAGFGVTERWNDQGFTGGDYKRLLVIGITTDRGVRHRFEDKLVTHLRARYEAVTSYTAVPDLKAIGSPGEVAQKLTASDVDGILMVSLVPIADDKAYADWAASWQASRSAETSARASVEQSLTRSQVEASRYAVEIELWDTASRRRVWSGRTEPQKRKAWRDGASELVQSLILALREDRKLP